MAVLTREQIEARLVTLHRASLELVGNLSLETVLERIVQLARQQAGARYAALGVLNAQGEFVKFIPVGMHPDEIAQMPHPPLGKGLIGAIRHERRTLRVPDISQDPRRVGFPAKHPPMRSFLGVPILLGDRLLGQLYLTDKEDYPEFTLDDEQVIETLAAYAAVAINNAQLYEGVIERDRALSQRNKDLALLNDLATALANAQDVETILDQTLARVLNYLEIEAGEIFLRDEDSPVMRLALHRGLPSESFWMQERFLPNEGPVGMAAQGGALVEIMFHQFDYRHLRRVAAEVGFRCVMCIPLPARGEVVGVLVTATRREQGLQEREKNLLTSIAALAGIAVETARLNRQSRRLAVLEERDRIGMDLHDGIIQSIYAVGLALDYARISLDEDPGAARLKIDQAIAGLNAAIRDIRNYILDLRPRHFKDEDLMSGLQRLVDEFHANTLCEITLIGPDDGQVSLPASSEGALFHICQEALANVAKHARARRAKVQLWTAPERVLLEISDDGRGFDLRKMSVTLGHGLSNMHTRARKVGGDVEITSDVGGGTTVLAWVPAHADDENL